jgi:hypothetical protein
MIKKKFYDSNQCMQRGMVSTNAFKITVSNTKTYNFQEIKSDFETNLDDFELFWYSKPIQPLRGFGLLEL